MIWSGLTRFKLDYLLIFLTAFLFLGWLQLQPTMGDPDGFYHAKLAEFLSQGQVLKSLPWMQDSTLAEHFTDQHFLYHWLLVPFLPLGDDLLAVKLATVVFGAVFFLLLYFLLKQWRARWPAVFWLALLISTAFIYRIGLVKANTVSLVFLLLLLWLLDRRKVWLVGLLGFFYVWLYGGWIIAWLVIGAHFLVQLVHYLRQPGQGQAFKLAARQTLFLFVGTLLGLVINPYWPGNLSFYWQQIVQIGIINYHGLVNVGGEWYSPPAQDVLKMLNWPLAALVITLALTFRQWRRWSPTIWRQLLLAIFFTLLVFKSQRYVELAAPFVILAAGSLSALVATGWRSWFRRLAGATGSLTKIYLLIFLISSSPILTILVAKNIFKIKNYLVSGTPVNRFQAESDWLAAQTPAGAIVLHSDWDDWPMLFYYNTHNYYIIGLDPTFMYNYDQRLYQQFADITTGSVTSELAATISNNFGASYIVAGHDHAAFQRALAADGDMKLVHQGPSADIYQIVHEPD